jgi:DNA polymerase I-like protein with 3'-5' exonuclease and polymerase domains
MAQLPNVHNVLILGNFALEAVLGQTGITNWRGSVVDIELPNGRQGRAVCTINPAYALRELKMEPIFRLDCQKLDLIARNVFKPYIIDEIINPTYREARAFIRDLRKSKEPVSLDTEMLNSQIVCYGLSNDPYRAMCISLRSFMENRYTVSEEYDILNDIQALCDSHRIIAQNAQFDAYIMRLRNFIKFKPWLDPLLAHHDLYPTWPHKLQFIVSQYTTHPFYKDEGKTWKEGGDIDQFWRYNCKDAALTKYAANRLLKELEQSNRTDFFFNHTMRATPHLIEATVHGLAVDPDARSVIVDQCREDVQTLLGKFHSIAQQITGDPTYYPNPRSVPDKKELFFDILKLKGKGTSTDEANRDIMLADPKTPMLAKDLINALNRYLAEDKFRGTFAESKVSEDERFRSEYRQFGVTNAPGRLSSAMLLTREGGNIQNQPVRARNQYVADPGCVIGGYDSAQAEARIVGWRARIRKWQDQFEKARIDGKYDAHRALASEMFKVPYDLVPKEDWDANAKPTIRYTAKRCRHGLNYRMMIWKLAEVTGLSYNEAAQAFYKYHQITPELRLWWEEEEADFKRTRVKFNAFGRMFRVIQKLYDVYGHRDEKIFKSLVAFYPQSTLGDLTTSVWYLSEEDDKWPDKMYARIAIDVHDHLACISTPKHIKTCLSIMKKHAERPIMIQNVYKDKPEPLIIPADLKLSVPTVIVEKKGNDGNIIHTFERDDKHGLHRWGSMEKFHL